MRTSRLGTRGPAGYPFIGYQTGLAYGPQGFIQDATTLTNTIDRIYYSPFFVEEAVTFTRVYSFNQGTGDNGETYHQALYANNGASGPGTRIANLGEVTLTGAAALRTQTISVDLSAYVGQWIWFMQHHATAAAMHRMLSENTGGNALLANSFGSMATAYSTANQFLYNVRYVDSSYGSPAATAVAPTAGTNAAPVMTLGKV